MRRGRSEPADAPQIRGANARGDSTAPRLGGYHRRVRALTMVVLTAAAVTAAAQHDITKVDAVAPDAAINTPLPEARKRALKKYDIPDLAGAEQALGSQLVDGRLRKPLIDYITAEGAVEQRLSIFEGGLVVVNMTGAATIRKRVLIPPDALTAYTKATNTESLSKITSRDLPKPEPARRAQLRVYDPDGMYVERLFHSAAILPQDLSDQLAPLRDLLRAISEDRDVTSTVAGYEPQPGDELVADDQKVYRVTRVVGGLVVELRCLDAPATIYVAKKDLNQYFVGRRARE